MKKKKLLDEIISDREDICTLYTRSNDAKQEIANINRTLRLHGEAHMAQDILPQFTELVKKVEKLEGQLNFKLNDGPIMNHSKRIEDLETTKDMIRDCLNRHAVAITTLERTHNGICTQKATEDWLNTLSSHQDTQDKRLADHDESIEALSETVDQLSVCKCQAGEQLIHRVTILEKSNDALWEAGTEQDAGIAAILKSVPDVEILKTQMAGVEERLNNSPFSKIVMEEYAENIKTLVRDVDTLKIQFENMNLHQNGMMKEILNQMKFLAKVQGILDREKDARIKKSPGYKKEIEAQKKEHMVMDKHVDMMVKKGRPVRK